MRIGRSYLPIPVSISSILGEILFDLIEQTGKEPGLTKVSKDQPFSVAEVNESGCTLCRSCANVCPTNAFRYNENENNLDFKHINCIGQILPM